MTDAGQQLPFANIAFSAAIVIVLLQRRPVRTGFGARTLPVSPEAAPPPLPPT